MSDIWNNLIGVVEILSSVYKEKTVEYTSILHKMVLNGHFKGNLERLPQVLDFLLENSFILQNCHVHTFDFFVTYLSNIDSWIHLPSFAVKLRSLGRGYKAKDGKYC